MHSRVYVMVRRPSVCLSVPSMNSSQGSKQTQSTKFKHFSRTFKDPNCIFQAPKLSTKSHILDADIQNLDCNVTLKCTVAYCTHRYRDMHTSACFKIVNKCKISNLQDLNSRTFQEFSSTFKHLICFQALSRALKFLFQIQAFSRISQARYEP